MISRLIPILLLGACAKDSRINPALLPGATAESATEAAPVCPWDAVTGVRLEPQTIWISGATYGVATRETEEVFTTWLKTCGREDAVPAFRRWREVEREKLGEARSGPRTGETIAAVAATIAGSAASGSSGGDGLPLRYNEPSERFDTTGPGELALARSALIVALTGRPPAPVP